MNKVWRENYFLNSNTMIHIVMIIIPITMVCCVVCSLKSTVRKMYYYFTLDITIRILNSVIWLINIYTLILSSSLTPVSEIFSPKVS